MGGYKDHIIANLWVIFGQADFSFRKNLLLILCIHHGIKDKIEDYKFYQITHHRVSRRHDHWLEILAQVMRMCEMRCELKEGTNNNSC